MSFGGSVMKGLTPEEFADLLSVGHCTVYRWIYDDLIQYVDRRVPKKYAERVKRLWDKTCTPSEFARLLKCSPSKVDILIRDGKLRTIRVVNKRRVFRKDLNKIRKNPNLVQPGDVIHKKKRGFARYTKKRKTAISRLGNSSAKRKANKAF